MELTIATRDDLDVREFRVKQSLGAHFVATAVALSRNPSIDFEAVICREASLTVETNMPAWPRRIWTGICSDIQQLTLAESGAPLGRNGELYAYSITVVPRLWLLGQRTNFKVWQAVSDPEIVLEILKSWGIEPVVECDVASFPRRRYRCQHGESDYRFVKRLLEESGISLFHRPTREGHELTLCDALHAAEPREPAIPFYGRPGSSAGYVEYATGVAVRRQVTPAKLTIAEHDPRLSPQLDLRPSSVAGQDPESALESYDYQPGAFVYEQAHVDTPVADARGAFRYRDDVARQVVKERLAALRTRSSVVQFRSNCLDLDAGSVAVLTGHQREPLLEQRMLVLTAVLQGGFAAEPTVQITAVPLQEGRPFRPLLETPKPKADGIVSATVVGPPGEEIHCDEFGRVRVQFHFDRDHRFDEHSSCWLYVSQPWAGTGYGLMNIPRVGQEVLVEFLSGDPDRPVITGRYFTNLQRPPYPLPEHKTRSVWRSSSTGGSGGFNELMFEDKAGHELVYLHAERDESVVVKRNATRSVGGDQCVSVGGGRRVSVGADYELRCHGDSGRIVVERGELDLIAVRTLIEARKELVLKVGKARLTLGPEGISLSVGETKLSIDTAGVRSSDASTGSASGGLPVAVLSHTGDAA